MVSSIYDTGNIRIGSIEMEGASIAAFDIHGRKLGTFETSIEAASAIMRRARMPVADADAELIAGVEAFMKAGHTWIPHQGRVA